MIITNDGLFCLLPHSARENFIFLRDKSYCRLLKVREMFILNGCTDKDVEWVNYRIQCRKLTLLKKYDNN